MSVAGECQSELWHIKLGILRALPPLPAHALSHTRIGNKDVDVFNLSGFLAPRTPLFSIIKMKYEEKARWKNKYGVFNMKNRDHHQKRTSVRLGMQISCWSFGRFTTDWTIARNQAAVHSATCSPSWEESQKTFQSAVQASESH